MTGALRMPIDKVRFQEDIKRAGNLTVYVPVAEEEHLTEVDPGRRQTTGPSQRGFQMGTLCRRV